MNAGSQQRNVAFNLLLTQILRDSMLENKKPANEAMVKSNWYDVAANPRDSLCSTVSEIRLDNSWAFFETGVRALVSKVSNWTLSSSSSSSSTFQAALAVQLLAETNPVDRAEKLPALCSFVQRRNKRMRRKLVTSKIIRERFRQLNLLDRQI